MHRRTIDLQVYLQQLAIVKNSNTKLDFHKFSISRVNTSSKQSYSSFGSSENELSDYSSFGLVSNIDELKSVSSLSSEIMSAFTDLHWPFTLMGSSSSLQC